jgi:Rab-like protein 5
VGVRILEFERDVKSKGGRVAKIQVEVWDASGDKKFENCWPAITRNVRRRLLH